MLNREKHGNIFSGITSIVLCVIALTGPLIFIDGARYNVFGYFRGILTSNGPIGFLGNQFHVNPASISGQLKFDIYCMMAVAILLLIIAVGYGLYGLFAITGHHSHAIYWLSTIARAAAFIYSCFGMLTSFALYRNFSELLWPLAVILLVIIEYMGMRSISEQAK